MSVAASVALAVAERVERTGGPRAGLVAWKTLAGNTTDGEVRGKALLAALRCALALRDTGALTELTEQWASVDCGVWDEAVASSCKALVRAGLLPRAVGLAHAETQPHRTLSSARRSRAPSGRGRARSSSRRASVEPRSSRARGRR